MSLNAKEWSNKQKTHEMILPSGMVVTVKENKLFPLMMTNLIPTALISKVIESEEGVKSADPQAEMESLVDSLKKVMRVVSKVVVSPVIIIEGFADESKNEISLMDIPEIDISSLIAYVMRGKEAEKLEPFRNGASSPDSGSDGAEIREVAVGDTTASG